MKEIISPKDSDSLISHGAVVLVSSSYQGKNNIISVSSQMLVTMDPLTIAISIGKERLSHEYIEKSKEFAVNIPTWELMDKVLFCGNNSGINVDKFKECNFTPAKGQKTNVLLIEECFANIECKVAHHYSAGDHTIFVGEAVQVRVAKDMLKEGILDLEKFHTIHQLGYSKFATLTVH